MPGMGISGLAWAPFALGAAIGFCAAVIGLRRWPAASIQVGAQGFLPTLRRLAVQTILAGALVTVAAGTLMSHHFFPGRDSLPVIQGALFGFGLGLAFGTRWYIRRGAR